MLVSQSQHFGTNQQLSLTPSMQQALVILQMSTNELLENIQEALDSNIMLDVDLEEDGDQNAKLEQCDAVADFRDAPIAVTATHKSIDDPLQTVANPNGSIQQHVMQQLKQMHLSPTMQVLTEYLADQLSDIGYLPMVPDLPAVTINNDQLATAVGIIQSCEPTGVGARDVAECMCLQLAERREQIDAKLQPVVSALLKKNLPLLAAGKLTAIPLKLRNHPLFPEAISLIKSLSPRPCAEFGLAQHGYITPDVMVDVANDGDATELHVSVNGSTLPTMVVNEAYTELMPTLPKQDQAQLRDHLSEARTLIRSVNSRYDTLLKVAEAMVQHQTTFFAEGVEAVRPMTLQMIADHLDIHESTVSRAVANKYLQTPHGVFPLRYFFSAELSGVRGTSSSAVSIKAMIKHLVAGEDRQAPLNDQALVDILAQRDVSISRRTVTKYRQALDIPASHQRRQSSLLMTA